MHAFTHITHTTNTHQEMAVCQYDVSVACKKESLLPEAELAYMFMRILSTTSPDSVFDYRIGHTEIIPAILHASSATNGMCAVQSKMYMNAYTSLIVCVPFWVSVMDVLFNFSVIPNFRIG